MLMKLTPARDHRISRQSTVTRTDSITSVASKFYYILHLRQGRIKEFGGPG